MRMNRYVRPAALALLLLGFEGGQAAAQQGVEENVDNTAYGTRAAEFLLIPVGARGTALGQAFAAIADDATALYWNPAGIALSRQASAHLTYYPYPAETSYSWGGVTLPLGGGDWVVGAQFGGFSFGDQPIYTVLEPEGTGATYSNTMFVGGLSLAMNVTDRFSFGVTGKYVQESLAQARGSTLAADIGTNYHTELSGRPIRASFAIMNLGGEIDMEGSDLAQDFDFNDPLLPQRRDQGQLATQSFPLPVMFKVGLTYEPISSPTNRLLVAGEFWQPQQNATTGAFGAEYMLRPNAGPVSLALRGGYTYEPDRSFSGGAVLFDDDGSDGLTFGGGLAYRGDGEGFGLSLDYAYRNMGLLGNTNQFSVTLGW